MTSRMKLLLCALLAVFALASLAAVLGTLGVLPAGAMQESYLLRSVDGRIAVFSPADADEPSMLTDIRVSGLPLGDRIELTDGVTVSDYGAVARLLEDYGA